MKSATTLKSSLPVFCLFLIRLARDDRPYWWQLQKSCTKQYDLQVLRQFKVTCESGPGFPSGHVMSSTAVVLTLLFYAPMLLQRMNSSFRKTMLGLLWLAGSIVVGMGAVSRVYIATHFPHQVICGVFVGWFVAFYVRKISIKYTVESLYSARAIFAGFAALVAGLAVFYSLVQYGLDPLATVQLALDNCQQREWVHLDTTLFYALTRDFSVLVGLGFGSIVVSVLGCREFILHKNHLALRIIIGVASYLAIQMLEKMTIAQYNPVQFYVLSSLKLMSVPLLVVALNAIAFCISRKLVKQKVC